MNINLPTKFNTVNNKNGVTKISINFLNRAEEIAQ